MLGLKNNKVSPSMNKKSILNFLCLAVFLNVLSACNASSEESEKKEAFDSTLTPKSLMASLVMEDEIKNKTIESKYILLTNTQKIDSKKYVISGETSNNCSKIIVNAYDIFKKSFDVYTLPSYTYGDTSFEYPISEAWNNLQEGENTYIFKAYCDDDQIKEASTSINYYGSYEDEASLEEKESALKEELAKIETLKKEEQALKDQAALENSASQNTSPTVPNSNKSTHIFYTSAEPEVKIYYCDTDQGWQQIPSISLKSFYSQSELLNMFPGRTLNQACI